MHDRRRWLAALPCTLIAIGAAPVTAGEPDDADAGAYILQAEMALQRHDYLVAAQEYRKAAERSDDSDVARRATRSAMAYGFNREALAAAKRWHKLDARNDEARVFLAQLSFRTGDVRAARRHFSYLVERGGEPPGDTLLTLVRYLSDEGDPGKADKLMRSLARPYPDSASAHRAVATMALKAGETAYALGRVSKAIELDADSLNSKLLYGRILLADGQPEKAIDYTARIIGDDPAPSPDARMELAILYMMVNRPDDALSQVNQVLLEHTGRMDALRLMAIINFHDLLSSGRFRMDALHYLGRIADYRQEVDRAIRFYGEVRHGSNALPSQERAAMLTANEKGNLPGALRQLDDFAAASPSDAVETLRAKARVLAVAQEYERALELYDKSVAFRPEDERVALSRAELLLRMDRLDDALAAYGDAARRWPKSALALNAYGYTLADRTDRYAEAEKLIRKALRYDPKNPAIIDSMGWVLFRLGRYEEALVELERAYRKLPDHEVAAHIVETLVALGRRDQALERLLAAEERTPGSALLQDVRSRLFDDAP